MVIVIRFVECDIDGGLPLVFLEFHVITGRECIDVHKAAMGENFVVDQRWELLTA